MAKLTRKSATLATFAKTLDISVDGKMVHVPMGKAENKALNCLLVSQMRQVFQENLKKIRDLEATITPREMKDLIDACAALTKSSGEAYQSVEDELNPKTDEKTVVEDGEVTEIDFTEITKPTNGNEPNTASSPPDPSVTASG